IRNASSSSSISTSTAWRRRPCRPGRWNRIRRWPSTRKSLRRKGHNIWQAEAPARHKGCALPALRPFAFQEPRQRDPPMMLGRMLLQLAGRIVARPIRRRIAAFHDATRTPEAQQTALLKDILHTQADTAYGRDHGFASIKTVADFRRQVPV